MLKLKRYIALFLALGIVAPFAVTYFLLQYQKHEIKEEVKHRLMADVEEEKLVTLKFTKKQARKELRWEHSKEFEHQGQMYDIVERHQKGDTLIFRCWPDDKETALNRKVKRLVKNAWGQDPNHKKHHKNLRHFVKNLFFEKERKGDFNFENSVSNSVFWFNYYQSLQVTPPAPPPQFS